MSNISTARSLKLFTIEGQFVDLSFQTLALIGQFSNFLNVLATSYIVFFHQYKVPYKAISVD
jgi:hypothetical protein